MSEKNEKQVDEKGRGEYRSLFWPMVFIGIGVVALLGNLGVFTRENFVVLFRLWPLLLILIGVDIMFGRRAPAIGALIGIGAVALVIGLMLVGPSQGWGEDGEVKADIFTEEIGEATSASVSLDLSSAPTQLTGLSDSPNLIEAELSYTGEIEFDVQGGREKAISLAQRGSSRFFWFDWFDEDDELHWEIGLSPQVPLDLVIDGGSGRAALDLSRLQLTELNLDVGSGAFDVDLPTTGGRFVAQVDGGSGPCTLEISQGATVDLEIDVGSGSFNIGVSDDADLNVRVRDGGSGRLTISVPQDAAVQLDVRDHGSGTVRVPSQFERTRRGDDDEGTWETPGYGNADHRITIIVEDMGSGDVVIQ